ncbi:MAG: SDR family oxidoreductase [Ignavibacteriaceae bacterium]|nr:SDR family oxidoreductase [Ignavibacteriaceae bacterium]
MKNNYSNLFNVENKRIAIIGATGLLGSQYVEYLSSLGAIVIIGDVDFQKCKELSDKLNKEGKKTYPIWIDNTEEESIVAFIEEIEKKYNGLDVLINNAQIKPEGFYAPFEKYTKATLTKVLDGNLVGVSLACREACNLFLKSGSGVIINVASTYGIVAADQRLYDGVKNIYFPDEKFSSPVSYAISKAGIVQLTKYLASYFREKNIRVNCLTPGGVFDNHDETFNKQYSYRTTMGRMAERDEYNGAILYLCSDASSYMTGANIVVDGGWSVI